MVHKIKVIPTKFYNPWVSVIECVKSHIENLSFVSLGGDICEEKTPRDLKTLYELLALTC
jgi:hypothetical protein